MGKGYQNLEKGCPKRGIMKALGVQFLKYDYSNVTNICKHLLIN